MLSLRSRFTYSNVVATLALVFAMSGGAYAASKFLITSTKQIKPSVLASLKGKAGANGAAGAQGAAGAVGPAGPAGGVGPQGPAGTAGTAGNPGLEGKAGKNGASGKEGSPWTANGTLPVGSTETGVWSMGPVPTGAGVTLLKTGISFPIPLAALIENAENCGEAGKPACVIHIFGGTNIPAGCTGTIVESNVTELKAASGNICVWVQPGLVQATEIQMRDPEANGSLGKAGAGEAGTHGGLLATSQAFLEETEADGTWAVTG
jgi:hypothetical protein